jgi:hypothetical protein
MKKLEFILRFPRSEFRAEILDKVNKDLEVRRASDHINPPPEDETGNYVDESIDEFVSQGNYGAFYVFVDYVKEEALKKIKKIKKRS